MSTTLPFALPTPADADGAPEWTGTAFALGDQRRRVLAFDVGQSGWSDELTSFEDEHAGGDHFTGVASRRHTLVQLQRHLTAARPVILEIGCSSGYFLRAALAAMPQACVVGADYVRGPLERLGADLAQVPLMQFDLTRCPLPSGTFDAIVLLNVLEHIEHDDVAVAQVARLLKPGGIAVIEVPAGPKLYDAYDALLHHHRRYAMRGLTRLVEGAGLSIVERSHLGFLAYPAFWVAKKLTRLDNPVRSEDRVQRVAATIAATKRVNAIGGAIMATEALLRRAVYLPFGIRCLLTCRKP
jgi:SAM-dependent methyltransferase